MRRVYALRSRNSWLESAEREGRVAKVGVFWWMEMKRYKAQETTVKKRGFERITIK